MVKKLEEKMNKMARKLLILGLVGLLLLTACVVQPTPAQNAPIVAQSSQQAEQMQTEANQKLLINNQPPPQITRSLERENIIRRLELLNDQNKVFYVYLLSHGKVMTFFTAKGKVSSVNSYLTSFSQVVENQECLKRAYKSTSYNGNIAGDDRATSSGCYFQMEAPDLDGTYGTNGEAIFFFTTEGAYVEWNGEYMTSDAPLQLTTPVELVSVKQVGGGLKWKQ